MQQVQNDQWQEAVQHLLAVRRPEQAEQLIRRHLAQHPRDAFAHVLLALALLRQNRLAEAANVAKTAISLNPSEGEGYYLLSLAQLYAGQLTAAESTIRHALELSPINSKYLGTLALILNGLERVVEAQVVAEAGLTNDPTHVQCLVQLVKSLQTQELWAPLNLSLQRLVQARPQLPFAHRALGQEAARQRQFAAAQAHYETALHLAPDDAESHKGLTQALRYQFLPGRLMYRIDYYGTFISEKSPFGKLGAFGLVLLVVGPISLFCIPLLLFVGFEAVYWRLHPKIRQLRSRPAGTRSYLQETLYRYGAVASVQLLILALLPILIWGILWLGLPKNSLGPVLTGGLTTLIMAMGQVLKETAAMPAPEKSPLGWVLLTVAYLSGSITAVFWPTFGPWEAFTLLLGNVLLLYWRFRTLRQKSLTHALQ
ncbi:tetratricopeptide repeat protein [Hymenobacter sp. HD11105]